MDNKEIVNGVWKLVTDLKEDDIHSHCARTVEYIMAESTLEKKSTDNITTVFIAFN